MTSDLSVPVASIPEEPTTRSLDESSVLGRNKHILLAALKHGGASSATVTYVGSGDSGGVEDVIVETTRDGGFDTSVPITVFAEQSTYQDQAWQASVIELQVSIDQALRDFAEEAVDLLHGGWEDGDGASGSVVFDCHSDTVRVEHSAYFTDSDYEETSL